MMMKTETYPEFEAIARRFLAEHHEIHHEWRKVKSIFDSRTDLICEPGSNREIFATLRSWQIAIGTNGEHEDFEDFGRGLSDKELAQEAFTYFVELLKRNGIFVEDRKQ